MKRGNNAIAGMDLKKSIINSNIKYKRLKCPNIAPKGIPTSMLIITPIITLLKVKAIVLYILYQDINIKKSITILIGFGKRKRSINMKKDFISPLQSALRI